MAHSQQGNESFSKHQFFRGRDEISPWSQAGPPGVHEIPELMLPSSFSQFGIGKNPPTNYKYLPDT